MQGPFVRAYGKGALIPLAMYDAEDADPGVNQESGLTFAGSDFQFQSDEQAFAALTAEYAAFTSGSAKPKIGANISGGTSGETAVVIGFVLSGGSWSGGDAAGTIFVEQVSGAWQNEAIDNDDSGATNVATLTADFTPSIGAAMVGVGAYVALTSSEMQCTQGLIRIDDQTATEVFIDDHIVVETVGHPDALHPPSGDMRLVSTTIAAVASDTDMDLTDGPPDDAGLPASSLCIITDQANQKQKTRVRLASYDQSDDLRVQFTDTPGFTVVAGDIIDIYAMDPSLAEILTDTGTTIPGVIGTPTGADLVADVASANALPPTNTALANLAVIMRDTNGDPVTGVSLTVTRSIDGGAFASATGTVAEVGNGSYQFDASQADMNGGIIVFRFTGSGAVDSFLVIVTDAAF